MVNGTEATAAAYTPPSGAAVYGTGKKKGPAGPASVTTAPEAPNQNDQGIWYYSDSYASSGAPSPAATAAIPPLQTIAVHAPQTTQIQAMADHFRAGGGVEITYSTTTPIIEAGQSASYVYIVLAGEVEVHIGAANAAPIEVTSGVLGEMSALLNIGATAQVVAKPGAVVLRIPAGTFRAYVLQNPEAFEYMAGLMEERFGQDMAQFFHAPESINNLYPEGQLPENAEHPETNERISPEDIYRAYNERGIDGVVEVITRHALKLALEGDPDLLRHWLSVAKGVSTPADALFIFETFMTSQTHLHPTRSLPLDFIIELGTAKLFLGDQYWSQVDAKVKPYIRQFMNAAGFDSIQDVFAALTPEASAADPARAGIARECLRQMTEYHPTGAGSLNEYLQVGSFISSLYTTAQDITAAAVAVAEAQYAEGVRYMELRFSADQAGLSAEEVIRAQLEGLKAAQEAHPDMECRAIIIFDTTMSAAQASQMAQAIINVKNSNPALANLIVGIDTAGPEVSSTGQGSSTLPESVGQRLGGVAYGADGKPVYFFDINKFSEAFGLLTAAGLQITTHGGENFASIEQGLDNISRAIEMGAVRIGHGIILGLDFQAFLGKTDAFGNKYTQERINGLIARQEALLRLVASRGIVIEVCPDSNMHTSDINYASHPINKFLQFGVRVTISNDNAVLDATSGPQQIFQLAQVMGNIEAVVNMLAQSYAYRMEGLHNSHPAVTEPAQVAEYAYQGSSNFTSNIPDLFKALVLNGQGPASSTAYLSADGRVMAADAFGVHLEGRTAGLPEITIATMVEAEVFEDPVLRELAHGHKYLYFVPITDSNGAIQGYIITGSDSPDLLSNSNLEAAASEIGNSMALAEYISSHGNTPSGARSMSSYYTDTRLRLQTSGRITEVYVNVSLHNINTVGGYAAGDAYKASIYQAIASYAEAHGVRVTVYDNGANFIITVEDQIGNLQQFMEGMYQEIGKIKTLVVNGQTLDLTQLTANGEPLTKVRIAGQTYDVVLDSAHTEPLNQVEIGSAGEKFITKLNAGEIENFSVEVVDAEAIRASDLSNRIEMQTRARAADIWATEWNVLKDVIKAELAERGITVDAAQLEELTRMRFVEPDSGLYNYQAFEILGERLGFRSVAMFDGNKFGAFAQEYGGIGNEMTNAAIYRMSVLAREIFAKYGIVCIRTGSRSEEFFLGGDVSSDVMQAAMIEFQIALNEEFPFSLKVGELKATEWGRALLEELEVRHPNIDYSNPESRVPMDLVRDIVHGGVTGLPMTVAVMEMAEGMSFSQTLNDLKEAAIEAKAENPNRGFYMVEVGPNGATTAVPTELLESGIIGGGAGLEAFSSETLSHFAEELSNRKVGFISIAEGANLSEAQLQNILDRIPEGVPSGANISGIGRPTTRAVIVLDANNIYSISLYEGEVMVEENGQYRIFDTTTGELVQAYRREGFSLVEVEGAELGDSQRSARLRNKHNHDVQQIPRPANSKLRALLVKAAQIPDPIYRAMVIEQLYGLSEEFLNGLTTAELNKIKNLYRDFKGQRSLSVENEASIRATLQMIGMSEEQITRFVEEMRWNRIEYRYGSEAVEIIKARVPNIMSLESVETLIQDMFKAWKGNAAARAALEGLGFDANQIQGLTTQVQEAHENYVEARRVKLEALRAKLAAGGSLTAAELSKYNKLLEELMEKPELREALGVSESEVQGLRQQLETLRATAESVMGTEMAPSTPADIAQLVEQIRTQALTKFGAEAEALGAGERVALGSFEELRRLGEMTDAELNQWRQEKGINRETAERLRFTAQMLFKEAKYVENIVNLAQSLGIDFGGMSLEGLSNLVYNEFQANGEGWRYVNPDNVLEFLRSEEGLKLLEEHPELRERIEELRAAEMLEGMEPAAKAKKVAVATMNLVAQLGMLLGFEVLAAKLGITSDAGKFGFVCALVHGVSEMQLAGIISSSAALEFARGMRVLGADILALKPKLPNFQNFLAARFSGEAGIIARATAALTLPNTISFLANSGSRFLLGMGELQPIMMAMGYGFQQLAEHGVISQEMLGSTAFQVGAHTAMLGGAMLIAQTSLYHKMVAWGARAGWGAQGTSAVSRLVGMGPLAAAGTALFIVSMVDMLIVRPLTDDYTLSLQDRSHDIEYDGARDAMVMLQGQDCADALNVLMSLIADLRLTATAADEAAPADFDHLGASQFDREELRQAILQRIQTLLGQDDGKLKQIIAFLRSVDAVDIHNADLERGVEMFQTFFNEDGSFNEAKIDDFINVWLFRDFSDIIPQTIAINNGGVHDVYNFNSSLGLLSEVDQMIAESRMIGRVAELYQQEQSGQPLNATAADKAAMLVLSNGQLNHNSPYFHKFISGQVYMVLNNQGGLTAEQRKMMLTSIQLRIIELRLTYLQTRDARLLVELSAYGDSVTAASIGNWEQKKGDMLALLLGMRQAVSNPEDVVSQLQFSALMETLDELVPASGLHLVQDETGNVSNANQAANTEAVDAADWCINHACIGAAD